MIRVLAVLVLAAAFSGEAIAQRQSSAADDAIFVAVATALHDASALVGADIIVSSLDGFVTLTGVARTMDEIAEAVDIALGVRGVTGVRNNIRMADRPSRA
ncbi:MAG TPA: BON domain-containing protein [Burkholderiales bacterium]